MKKTHAKELLEKYRLGTTTDEEKALVETWYNKYTASRPLVNLSVEEIEEDLLKIAEKVRFEDAKIKRINNKRFIVKLLSAAAVAIFVSVASFLYFNQTPATKKTTVKVQKEIAPAQNKAILTLANNKKIILDDSSIGELANQTGISISKTADGKLKYKILEDATETDAVQYNTIQTPRGAQYQIELADGSLIWLNASSSIRFPTRFASNSRTVNVTGEVYFEVAKNPNKPFMVNTGGQLIQVLGTHFNVDAHDKNFITTTLLEGSVKISSSSNHNTTLLVPGEQSVYNNRSASINVTKVDTEKAVCWKNGYFLFISEDLSDIMEEISRWYDVDIIYHENKKTNQKYCGTISRSKSLSQVLKILEVSGNVNFKLDERRVVVMF